MGMGIVSNKDFAKESKDLNVDPDEAKPTTDPLRQIPESVVIDVPRDSGRGRGEGSTEVPDSLRQLIGTESVTNGRSAALELAESFGISPSSVSAYAQGATSTASYDDRPNAVAINDAKLKVQKKARGRLMKAMHYMTDEKLEVAKVRELAGIAKDMSAVIKNMESPSETEKDNNSNGPTFVFYSPHIREERHFDIVKSKE